MEGAGGNERDLEYSMLPNSVYYGHGVPSSIAQPGQNSTQFHLGAPAPGPRRSGPVPCPGLQAALSQAPQGVESITGWPRRKGSSMGRKHYPLLGTGGILRVPALSTSSCRGGIGLPSLSWRPRPMGWGSGPTLVPGAQGMHRAP